MAPLQLESCDMIAFSKSIFLLFKELAEKKEIKYEFISDFDEILCVFDFDKVEKIITNLISNAIKFTDYGGKVTVFVKKMQPYSSRKPKIFKLKKRKPKSYIEITVKDTGRGMNPEELKNVFSRFNNLDDSKSGTGVGLNFTKGLVEMHGGEIDVNSQPKKGSEFIVKIPFETKGGIEDVLNQKNEFLINSMKSVEYNMLTSSTEEVTSNKKNTSDSPVYTVLIVEDNRELRMHLKKLKSKLETCHIPIVLLTARSREEDLISGYEHGADAYLPKPFKIGILKSRIKNLLEAKERLREKFSKLGALLPSSELTTNSIDEAFLEKVTKVIIDNISDEDFQLSDLFKEVGIGRSQFYRKINSITGQNPSKFVRTVRLKYASELLLKKNLSIKEVAHMCGFSSSTYFGKTFKELFNLTPSEYVEEYKKS